MKLQILHEEQVDYSQITQLVARKYPHPLRPGRTMSGTWMGMLGDLHIANIRRETMNWVVPKWGWKFKKDIPRYIYHPLIRATLTRLTREIEYADHKGPTKTFTADIHEGLDKSQLNNIIKDIKLRLPDTNFGSAVRREMKRYGYQYGDKAIYKQIGDEMRRRSALVRKSKAQSGKELDFTKMQGRKNPHAKRLKAQRAEYGDLEQAIKYANKAFEQALIDTPELDSVDKSDYISDAAARFNVRYQDVAAGMKLRNLHESIKKVPQLNIFTTLEEDIRTAFDLMEHDGFYDESRYGKHGGDSRYEIKGWFNAYERLKAAEAHSLRELELVRAGDADTIKDIVSDWPEHYSNTSQEELVAQLEQELIEYHGPNKSCGGAIYGDGGWNRYWIRYGGDIGFSAGHAQYPQKETIQNAKNLGFHVF